MIAECTRCGDPLFPHMERCAGCGVPNPDFPTRPTREDVYTTDAGTEVGLFGLGTGGLVTGGDLLFARAAHFPALSVPFAALCSVVGVAFLVAFRRVTVRDLGPAAKAALRAAMFAAGGFYGLAYLLAG